MVKFITNNTDILIGSNTLSVRNDTKKVVWGSRTSNKDQDIVGGYYTNHLIYIEDMSKDDTQDCLKDTKPEENKSELEYEFKIPVLSLQCVRVGFLPYIVIAGH